MSTDDVSEEKEKKRFYFGVGCVRALVEREEGFGKERETQFIHR